MLTHYTHAMRHYAIFCGRASRAEFWSFYVVYILAAFALALLDQAYFGTIREESGIITLLFAAVHALPGMALQVRRLHDIDRSGWWILVNLTGIGIFAMLIVAMLRGTQGPNSFGPEPGDFDEADEAMFRRGAARSQAGYADPRYGRDQGEGRLEAREPSFAAGDGAGLRYDDRSGASGHDPRLTQGAAARAHSASPASVRSRADLIGDLERLAALRASGGLTEAEFEVMKAQALSRRAPALSHDIALASAFIGTTILFWAVMLVPIIIAFWRCHPSRWLILIVTIAFGATVVGWLIALVWSLHGFHRGADRASPGGASGLNLFVDDVKRVRLVDDHDQRATSEPPPSRPATRAAIRYDEQLTIVEAAELLERLQWLKSRGHLSAEQWRLLKAEVLGCT